MIISQRLNNNTTNKNQNKKLIVILLLLITLNYLLFSNYNSEINFQQPIPSYLFKITKLKYKYKLNPDEIVYMGERKLIKDVINSYLSLIDDKYKSEKDNEFQKINNYLQLKNVSGEPTLLNDIRNSLLTVFSEMAQKNLSQIDTIFLTDTVNFGNAVICLNNLIFYCEVLGCKNITLNSEKTNWYIKNPIISEKSNITIHLGDRIDCNETNIACLHLGHFFFPLIAKSQLRVNIIKDEILRNLPRIETNPNDLFIHFRTGDVFTTYCELYAQPPFCFYDKIIKGFKFNRIYIIAQDDTNKVITELIKKYPTIIFKQNSLEVDIAYLSYAYNIASSTSSFLCSIIKLNDNLKYLWEYDIYRLSEKIYHMHYHIFNFQNAFTIFSMKPSDIYRNELFLFNHTQEQLQLMLEDKCPHDFITFQSSYDIIS